MKTMVNENLFFFSLVFIVYSLYAGQNESKNIEYHLQKIDKKIFITCGSITNPHFKQLKKSALVSAANKELNYNIDKDSSWKVEGIAKFVRMAAGPEIEKICRTFPILDIHKIRCKTGDAKITQSFKMQENGIGSHIIHTVGPDLRIPEENKEKESLLSQCYKNSLEIADNNGLECIAFPPISTGIYGYPKKEAARLSLNACIVLLCAHVQTSIEEIHIILYDKDLDSKEQMFTHEAVLDEIFERLGIAHQKRYY